MHNLLFIHGFNSSPLSQKAQQTKAYVEKNLPHVNFHCPQLETTPNAVIHQLEQLIKTLPNQHWALIGSSLGGYFATYLSEVHGLKAVLINPAVKPFELLANHIGEQVNPYTNQKYRIEHSYLKDLVKLNKSHITKNNYMVMVQTGDEVLDYQQAVNKFSGCELVVESGGDHRFEHYDDFIPKILSFLDLTS